MIKEKNTIPINRRLSSTEKEAFTLRFLEYVKICTASDSRKADSGIMPSTECQMDFAKILKDDLYRISDDITVTVTKNGYVIAKIPASKGYECTESIGFAAHMDTVEDVSGENIKPNIIRKYDGKSIFLKNNIVLNPQNDENLREAEGETIITTDGTTLLGADDKAGITIIMAILEYFYSNKEEKHGPIEVMFSPDEETGHGMDKVPLELLSSKMFFTFDGGHIGEIESECFNAYKADIFFKGVSMHTGTARPKMVNAVTMASKFVSMLPQNESPETTDNYQGFYAPMEIEGNLGECRVQIFLRDFDINSMKERIENIKQLAQTTEKMFRGSSVTVKTTQQYLNMSEKLSKNPKIMARLKYAVEQTGIDYKEKPIRGGTDGSRLTELGIPTPNIFTGGHNFHSQSEWVSVDQMQKAIETGINLVISVCGF